MIKSFLLALIPLSLVAQGESQSMLYKAGELSKKFNLEIAKAPPPLLAPQAQSCLDAASIWFTIDLQEVHAPAFTSLQKEPFWDTLGEIGVEAVHLKGLKKGGQFRTGIGIDPKWGDDWDDLAILMQKKGMVLIGDSLGNSTGISDDFSLALKNVGDYPSIYHLVEIEKKDWKNLPQTAANVPWLTLQNLQKKGYVPEQFNPYVKESSWNATSQIKCVDGKVRRWIYLKENSNDPVIDWLNPSFAACRIAAADTLDSVFNIGQKIYHLDAAISQSAKETLALWTRKLGCYTVLETKNGLDEMRRSVTDLISDTLTRPALLHAMLTEDAEALKLMYRLYLQEEIETKRLVHVLQPFDEFACDWGELLLHPKKQFKYYEETLTGEALRSRLLKQDVASIGESTPATWPKLCMNALGLKDFEKKREDVTDLHLLLALFYAMQPGAFSFSLSDLLGTLTHDPVQLLAPNENTVYGSLSSQMKNTKSFAMQLRKILSVRKASGIESGMLLSVPNTNQKGLMVLIHQLRGSQTLQLLAINFSRTPVQQTFDIPHIRQTTAIDLMTGLAEKKPLESSSFRLDLSALSGKVILFQPKYYD